MNKLPQSRTTDVVVQHLGKEILIYDLSTDKAFNLNETSAIVYQACDGKTSVEELRSKTKFTADIIFLAIDELRKDNLVEADDSFVSPFAGMSRRDVIRKVGLASMVTLPMIAALTAPLAAHAQSIAVNACIANSCVDGNVDCNDGAPCSALGAGFVCCFALGSCSCAPAAVCTDNGGTVCA